MTLQDFLSGLFWTVVGTIVAGGIILFLNNIFNWGLIDRIRLFFASSPETRIAPLESLLAIEPSNDTHRRNLCDSYIQIGNITQAIATFLPIVTSGSPAGYDIAFMASLYLRGGWLEQAEEWTRKALERSPYNVDYAFMLVEILNKRGKNIAAIRELRKLVHLHYQIIDAFEKSPPILNISDTTSIVISTGNTNSKVNLANIDQTTLTHYQALVKLQQKLILIYEDREQKRLKGFVEDFLDQP